MANKYIRHGETYDGDGTTSAAAASDGAAGAWNDINILEGTTPAYGSLAAGDTVYIRSKDAAEADITVSHPSTVKTLGSAAATYGYRITWIIDAGSVWAGVAGTIKYTSSAATTYNVTLRTYNNLIAEAAGGFVVENTSSVPNQLVLLGLNYCYTKNISVWWAGTGTNGFKATQVASGYATCENLAVKAGKIAATLFGFSGSSMGLTLINPDIELAVTTGTGAAIFPSGHVEVNVIGGRLYGAGATSGTYLITKVGSACLWRLQGFQYPNTVAMNYSWDTTYQSPGGLFVYGADKGVSSGSVQAWGSIDTRRDDNYPTLSGLLPDSAGTHWSYKIYPAGAREAFPANVILSKIHTGDDAALTFAVEFLVADSFAGLDSSTVSISGQYIGTDGIPVGFSTKALVGAALDASTASWSATTYGTITLLKRKIAITTQTAVKKDTMVMIRFACSAMSASVNDLIFLNPDF